MRRSSSLISTSISSFISATVSTEGGQSPIILVEREPEIRGVIVVAEGAADPAVRLSLQRAVQAVTGVPLSCIEVFEMNYPS